MSASVGWLHPALGVGASEVAGQGLFTTADLPAGMEVVRLKDPRELLRSGHGCRLNHGCDPTLGWTDATTLVTLTAVSAGTELLTDYALATTDPAFLLRCHCASYRCRQMVEGSDWQIPVLQQRYDGWWAPAVQERIDAARA